MKKLELDVDKFIERYNDGATHHQLCKEFGICPGTLLNRIKEYSLPPRKKQFVIDIEAFREAFCSGLSSRQLSKRL